MTHLDMIICSSLIIHPITMKFWLKTFNNIYKTWYNSHIDRIIFTVSKLEIKKRRIYLDHPVGKLLRSYDQYIILLFLSLLQQ